MSNTLETTIQSALPTLPYGADEYVRSATDALLEREYTLTDQITNAVAVQFGVPEYAVQSRLEAIGMAVRPAPVAEPVAAPLSAVPDIEDSGTDLLTTDDTEEGVTEQDENTESDTESEVEDTVEVEVNLGKLAKVLRKLDKRLSKLEKVAKSAKKQGLI